MAVPHEVAFIFSILGNVVSFSAFLVPAITFTRIVRERNICHYHSAPYVVSLFSASLWVAYTAVKGVNTPILLINLVGCVAECIYIFIFLCYADKKARIRAVIELLVLNGVIFLCIVLPLSLLRCPKNKRAGILGGICSVVAVLVCAAPLSKLREEIRTKCVKGVPIQLSCFLTLGAVIWFVYGLVIRDLFVALPNVLGFLLGVVQIVLYLMYRGRNGAEVCASERFISEVRLSVGASNVQLIVSRAVEQAAAVGDAGGEGGAVAQVNSQAQRKRTSESPRIDAQVRVLERNVSEAEINVQIHDVDDANVMPPDKSEIHIEIQGVDACSLPPLDESLVHVELHDVRPENNLPVGRKDNQA